MSLFATEEGTARFRARFNDQAVAQHYREAQGLWLSSIGFGTYLGPYDDETDINYIDALVRAVELGCNSFDTAINYRCQRSERSIGAALKIIFREGKASRDEIIIATKGGYIPFDNAPPEDIGAYLAENFLRPGVLRPDDIVAGSHCISPRYIGNQLERSLANLSLSAVDIYYLHNPEEQLRQVSVDEFHKRMGQAFHLLEEKVSQGRIKMYGAATWGGFRQEPGSEAYLSLEGLVKTAKSVAGENHHFKVIQVPFNLAMPEALVVRNQSIDGEMTSLTEAASRLGISVIASSSLLQSQLSRNLPAFIGECLNGLETDAQRALQFVRSTPGITSALVGMSNTAHVEENLSLARIPPASMESYARLFSADK